MTQLTKNNATGKVKAYAGIPPTEIGRTSSNKRVMTHDHEKYSEHYTKDDHFEASRIHRHKAYKLKNDHPKGPAHLVEHHYKLATYHEKKGGRHNVSE